MRTIAKPFSSSTDRRRWPLRIGDGLRISIGPLILRDDLRALEIEAESHLLEALLQHGVAQAPLVAGVEHEEAAPAGADQLPAEGAVGHRVVVPLVDLAVAHAGAARLL